MKTIHAIYYSTKHLQNGLKVLKIKKISDKGHYIAKIGPFVFYIAFFYSTMLNSPRCRMIETWHPYIAWLARLARVALHIEHKRE